MTQRLVTLRWWGVWFGALCVLTLVFLSYRSEIDRVHVALAFLLVVLGGSATGGRPLGLSLTAVAYLDFHFFFIAHFDSLAMENPLDALVLVAFLVTGFVAEQLVTRARAEADLAEARAAEVERLAILGAESLSAGRADEALGRVLELVRASAGAVAARIETEESNASVPDPLPPTELRLPLQVHGQPVGRLILRFDPPVTLSAEQGRFLDALSFYAALAIERVRLASVADRAEALRQEAVLKESILAGLSHDLRTPLTTIKALASQLDPQLVPAASMIEQEADRLHRFASDLLDLSRLQAGATLVHTELNTAADLVGAALQRLRSGGHGDRVTVCPFDETDGEPLTGRFDFVLALRALGNLLENGLKYSPRGSLVELTVTPVGDRLRFRVSDRGGGIAPAEADRIFEPFYRVPSAAPDAGGAGLGLAIARRLAREQGGDVTFTPRHGGGSCFDLWLPAASMSPPPPDQADLRAAAISISESLASP